MAFIVGELVAPVDADTRKFDKGMDEVKQKGDAVAKDVSKKFGDVGATFTKVGTALTMSVTMPLLAVGAAAFKMGKDFELELSRVVGLVGIAQEQVDDWGQDILDMAPELGKAPQELASALYFITSAGIDASNAMDVLTISARSSTAGLGDTAMIADALTSALNAYGVANLSASKAADILVAAVKEGKMEADALTPVLGNILPTSSALGISFNQVAGTLAVMSKTGLGAAEAATSLSAIMSTMLKPTDEAAKMLASAGLSMGELRDMAQKQPDGLVQVLRTLDTTFGDNDEALAAIIPNIRAFKGAMNVLAQDAAGVDSVLTNVANSTGMLDRAEGAAAATTDHLWNQVVASAKVTILEVWSALRESLIPIFEKLVEKLSSVTDWFKRLDDEQKQHVIQWAAVAAAIGPILLITGKLITSISAVKTAITGLYTALTWLAGHPIILALMALITVIGLVVNASAKQKDAIKKHTEETIEEYKRQGEEAKKTFQEIADAQKKSLDEQIKAQEDALAAEIKILDEEYQAGLKNIDKQGAARKKDLEKQKDELKERLDSAIEALRAEYGVFESTQKSKMDLIQEEADARKSLLDKIMGKYTDALAKEKTAHEDNLKKIESVYGKYEELEKSKTDALMEGIEERKDLLDDELDDAEDAAKEQVKIAKSMYEDIVREAESAYDKKLKLLYDADTNEKIKTYQDQIDALDAQTKVEKAMLEEQRNAAKVLELQKRVDSAETDEDRAKAAQDLAETLQEIAIDREAAIRETQIDSLKEQIAAIKQAASDGTQILSDANVAKKALLDAELEEAKVRAKTEYDGVVASEALKLSSVQARIVQQKLDLDAEFAEAYARIEEEKAAAIAAENDRYAAAQLRIADIANAEVDAVAASKTGITDVKDTAVAADTDMTDSATGRIDTVTGAEGTAATGSKLTIDDVEKEFALAEAGKLSEVEKRIAGVKAKIDEWATDEKTKIEEVRLKKEEEEESKYNSAVEFLDKEIAEMPEWVAGMKSAYADDLAEKKIKAEEKYQVVIDELAREKAAVDAWVLEEQGIIDKRTANRVAGATKAGEEALENSGFWNGLWDKIKSILPVGEVINSFKNEDKEEDTGYDSWDDILLKSGNKEYGIGGVVSGPIGMPVPAIVHGGEVILNPAQQQNAMYGGAGGGGVTFSGPMYFQGVQDVPKFMQEMRNTIKRFTGRTVYVGY